MNFFDRLKSWIAQHKKATIGIAAGGLAIIAAVVGIALVSGNSVSTGGKVSGDGITRGQWIKMFGERFTLMNYDSQTPYYSDVPSDNEVFAYVQTFVENEIMSGEGTANLDEKITLEEAYLLLARNYGISYLQGAIGKEELSDTDLITYISDNVGVGTDLSGGITTEQATELLDKAHDHYLNRQFRNYADVDYAENVLVLSTVTAYTYSDSTLTLTTDSSISEGQVLVLGENEEYPCGVALKVDSMEKKDNQYTLKVSVPELEEVVDSLYIETSQLIGFENFEPAEGVTILEIGDESPESAMEQDILVASNQDVALDFNANIKGKFAKFSIDFESGKIKPTLLFEKLSSEVEFNGKRDCQYYLDENGKMKSKYEESGFEVKGTITLKDLVLNGSIDAHILNPSLKFDINTGLDLTSALSIEGNVKGKEIYIGRINTTLGLGLGADIEFYLHVDFEGKATVKTQVHTLLNLKKKAGKSINHSFDGELKATPELKFEAQVKGGPDITFTWLTFIELADIYANLGAGAEATYTTDNLYKVTVDVYGPTIEAGVGKNKRTALYKSGIKAKFKLMDYEGALFKCPFTAQYTYDILTDKWNWNPETESSSVAENESSNNIENESSSTGMEETTQSTAQQPTTQTPTQKPTEAPTTAKKYQLSTQGYEEAGAFGTNTYIVKQNGLWGVVDFNGNVKIPITYTGEKAVGNGEYEFTKNGVGYVYNINTCKLLFSYNKVERISNPEAYEDASNKLDGSYYNGNEWVYDYYRIERTYNKGMMLEAIPYAAGYSSYIKFTFKRGNTNIILTSGFGNIFNSISSFVWNSTSFSSTNPQTDNDNTAIAIEPIDMDNCNIHYVTPNGCTITKFDPRYAPYNAPDYNKGWIKDFDRRNLINAQTGQIIKMPYDNSIDNYYHGNGLYYAVSTYESDSYDICKGNTILSSGWKGVNFSDSKYIIAQSQSGDLVFMDYNCNRKATYKDASLFHNGRALVSDGTGYFYIDENLNKVSDYIYKGTGYASTNALKIGDKYYLISQ